MEKLRRQTMARRSTAGATELLARAVEITAPSTLAITTGDVKKGATVAEAILEVGQVVADAVEGAEPLDEAGGDLLTGGSRPELDSARHRALPHGGRQLS
jgi:hypothetical protein